MSYVRAKNFLRGIGIKAKRGRTLKKYRTKIEVMIVAYCNKFVWGFCTF